MNNTDHLLSLLGKQREVLTRLLELVREERYCLIHNETERLEAVIEEQVTLLATQRASSTRITHELATLSTAFHLDGPLSLSRVIEHLPSPQADQLQKFHRELSTLSNELQREGRLTWHMAQQAMNYIEFALKLIGKAKMGAVPYAPQTRKPQASVQLMIDNCA